MCVCVCVYLYACVHVAFSIHVVFTQIARYIPFVLTLVISTILYTANRYVPFTIMCILYGGKLGAGKIWQMLKFYYQLNILLLQISVTLLPLQLVRHHTHVAGSQDCL